MTDSEMHEMRIRLAKAMGWHNIRTSASNAYDADGCQYQSHKVLGAAPGARPESNMHVPNPLESDRDAALLRAWCVAQGWYLDLRAMPDCLDRLGPRTGCTVTVRYEQPVKAGMYWAYASEEPDYCRRERLSLCRAVLAVLEAAES